MNKAAILSTVAIVAVSFAASAAPKDKSVQREARLQERFMEADINKDGAITHAEMLDRVRVRFDEFDKDRNGYLELSELPKIMPLPEQARERMERKREKVEERMERRGKEMPERLKERFDSKGQKTRVQFVARNDKDQDERVSFEEFSRKATHKFKRGDVNGDGQITIAELEEAKQRHMKKRAKEKRRHRG